MLRTSDLAGYDLPALSAALRDQAARRGRAYRWCASIVAELEQEISDENAELIAMGADPLSGHPAAATRAGVFQMDADSAACAQAADLIDVIRRVLADEARWRPELVALPRPAVAPSLRARVLAILGRGPSADNRADAA